METKIAGSPQSLLFGQKHFDCNIGSQALQEGENKIILKKRIH